MINQLRDFWVAGAGDQSSYWPVGLLETIL
jgi:hypothetical protein